MTLEEAIARCEKIVKEAKKSYEVPVADGIMAEVGMELTKKGIEEYQQYTEWLKELSERRKADNEIPFGNAPFSELDSIINAYEMHGNHKKVVELLKELSERRKQPERKVGKWTEDNACEFCGFKPWYERDIHTLSYCPNCGADMKGEQYE